MAQEASMNLTINLETFAAGLKGALRMGQEFITQFNRIASGVQIGIDEGAFKAEIERTVAEVNKLAGKEVDLHTEPAQEAIKAVGTQTDKTANKVKSGTKMMHGSWAEMSMGINQAMEIMRKTAYIFNDFFNKAIAYKTSQTQFNAALANTGQYTREASESVSNYAQRLQVLLGVDDDMLLQETARMEQLGKFSSDTIPQNMRAAIGLAEIYQVDLPTAFSVFGKVAAGVPVRLSNFGMGAAKAGEATVSLNELLEKGAAGFELATQRAQNNASQLQRNKASNEELRKSIGSMLIDGLAPILEKMTTFNYKLAENRTALKILLGGIVSVTAAMIMFKVATINLTAALTALKTSNPLGWITLGIGAIATAVEATVGWAQVWAVFYNYTAAALRIAWSYIKAFGITLKDAAVLWIQILTLPWTMLYNTASQIMSKLAGMMKKLVAGDFAGIWKDLKEGIIAGVASPMQAIGKQVEKTLDNFAGLGEKAAAEWRTAGVMAAWASTQGKRKDAQPTNMPQVPDAGAGEGGFGTIDERAKLIEDYYNDLRWQAAGYEEFMRALYQAEYDNFVKVTGDKDKAQTQLDANLKALEQDKSDYEFNLWQEGNDTHRKSFEQRKSDLESYMQKLENWKQLGISVTGDLQIAWDSYLKLLKEKSEESTLAYEEAESGKVALTEAEMEILKNQYTADVAAYNSALVKKHEIDLRAAEEQRRLWEDNHKTLRAGFDAIADGWRTMFDSMFDMAMKGSDRLKAIGNSIKDSLIRSFGETSAKWIKNQLTDLAMHSSIEKSKTAVTAASEGTRTSIHGTNLLIRFAKDVLFAVKTVALEVWKFGAALLHYFAFLGPFAPIAAAAVVVGGMKLIDKLRKGFYGGGYTGDGNEKDEAGAVHKQEFVYESEITKKNRWNLEMLRQKLKAGMRWDEIFMPRVQSFSFAGAGGGGGAVDYAQIGREIGRGISERMNSDSNSGMMEVHIHVDPLKPTTVSKLNRQGEKMERLQT